MQADRSIAILSYNFPASSTRLPSPPFHQPAGDFDSLYRHYRDVFAKVTEADIHTYEAQYRGSAEETRDLQARRVVSEVLLSSNTH